MSFVYCISGLVTDCNLFLKLVAQKERVVNETKLVDKHDKFGRLIPQMWDDCRPCKKQGSWVTFCWLVSTVIK